MYAFAGVFVLLCAWVDAQAFLAEEDGTVLSVGVPDTLSTACQTALNQTTQCNSTLSFVAFDGLFPSSDVLAAICTDSCKESLQSFRSQEVEACGDEYYHVDGKLVPASYSVDQLLFTYTYTCLQDGTTNVYCAPLIDEWSQAGPTAEQSCSECMLKTFQVELNSPFGYDDEFASYYRSLTSSCGVSDYPITLPPSYTVTATSSTSTTTSVTPSISCASKYAVKKGDDCSSVSQAQQVSEAMLRYNNEIAADCSNFPDVGTSLCLPATCDVYTLQANQTCYDIALAYNSTFTVTQLISWNPDINRDCSNLEVMVGTHLCVSAPGDTGESSVTMTPTSTIATPIAAPTNVANGTNTRCAKYYEAVPGDTCSSITVKMAISVADFYFLNPEINSTSCSNLLAGSSYCVQAVGDIATYSGYGGYSNPCVTLVPLPSSCIATAVTTTDSGWTFPTYTTNTTQPTPLPLAAGTWSNCSTYTQYIAPVRNASTINSCYVVASMYDVDVTDFVSSNPSLSYDQDADDPNDCQLKPGYQYCLQLSKPTTTPTTTTTTTATSTTSSGQSTSTGSNGQPTPLPIQDGMTTSCGAFYLVKTDDSCYDIAASNNIAIDKLYTWNPALNGDCTGLYPNYYICVGSIGSTTATTTTTTTSGGVSTPTPTQSGMISGCKSFYFVQSGDSCYDIAADNGIALDTLYLWNPALNGDCSGLWPDYYICVGL
ncbi:hypothetical protein P170DRAFT_404258 [Aspergillus steynii IBT 23096]|uniref:LysM domain-containing protein n=1 Tax=Aspergillus steynii IBT 23096 TaxID=1392250 RepID=A0A2I2GK88_9EURO|nr:uncharacterized protein P170DRAFT_404258 [Aspergillus steynii IBT 23096]PLB53269.1 hypothetical protein P170DRAFT_404258 [Aspergillus steynii IBT 23096]